MLVQTVNEIFYLKGEKMRIKKVFNTKKKIIAGSIILGVVIIATGAIYALTRSQEVLKLKKEEMIIEYGQAISTDPKDYLNFDEVDSKKKIEILKNAKLKSNISNEVEIITNEDGSTSEKDKGYAKAGNYEITLTYKKESKTVKIKVKDTVAPELTVPERVEIIQGTDLSTYDFKSLMMATDLAQLSDYTIDTAMIDVNVPGEYSAKVSIEDASKNKTEKEFKVIVVAPVADPNVEITSEVQTDPVTGQKKTVVTTKPKQNTTTNGSSSSSSSNSSNSSNKPSSGNTNNSSSGNSGSINQPPSGGNSSSGGSGSSGNSSGGNSNSGSSSSGSTNNNGSSGGSIQIISKYKCNLHGGEYNSLEELIAAGHFTGGCGSSYSQYGSTIIK